jgi:hypothetical protein
MKLVIQSARSSKHGDSRSHIYDALPHAITTMAPPCHLCHGPPHVSVQHNVTQVSNAYSALDTSPFGKGVLLLRNFSLLSWSVERPAMYSTYVFVRASHPLRKQRYWLAHLWASLSVPLGRDHKERFAPINQHNVLNEKVRSGFKTSF